MSTGLISGCYVIVGRHSKIAGFSRNKSNCISASFHPLGQTPWTYPRQKATHEMTWPYGPAQILSLSCFPPIFPFKMTGRNLFFRLPLTSEFIYLKNLIDVIYISFERFSVSLSWKMDSLLETVFPGKRRFRTIDSEQRKPVDVGYKRQA